MYESAEVLATFFGVTSGEVLDAYAPKRHLSGFERGYQEPITHGQAMELIKDAEEVAKNV